jgi:ADP-dependent phosphofructokinase/glucokinase
MRSGHEDVATHESFWRSQYRKTVRVLRERAADPAARTIATGFTTNLDLVIEAKPYVIVRLLEGLDIPDVSGIPWRPENPAQLMAMVLDAMAAGVGFDFPIDAATHQWLLDRVDGEYRVGGNGAIVANTLATLGLPTLLHLTSRSQQLVNAFERPDRVMTPSGNIRSSLESFAICCIPAPIHIVLEYPAGLDLTVAGRRVVSARGNRIIVAHDPVNANVTIDPEFVALVAEPATGVDRVLLAAYSQMSSRIELQRIVAESIAALSVWRRTNPSLLTHLELGAMPDLAELAYVVESLGPQVDSIGLNDEEMRDLTSHWGTAEPDDIASLLGEVKRRTNVRRVVVHTASFAMSLTAGDPGQERTALMAGILVAAARAAHGRYPNSADLDAVALRLEFHPDGSQVLQEHDSVDGIALAGEGWLVFAPALHVERPAVNVGLGDCFTAGLLAMS